MSGGASGREGSRMLGPQLELRLIGTATEIGGRFSTNDATAEEPLVALSDVVGVGVGNGGLRDGLPGALRLYG